MMETILCPNPKNFQLYHGGIPAMCSCCWLAGKCAYEDYVRKLQMGKIEKRKLCLGTDGRLYNMIESKDGVRSVDVTDEVAKTLLKSVLKDNLRLKENTGKENAIILNGVRYNLVEPDVESCSNCDLDKFCDKFKDALCNIFTDGNHGMIFKKQE